MMLTNSCRNMDVDVCQMATILNVLTHSLLSEQILNAHQFLKIYVK